VGFVFTDLYFSVLLNLVVFSSFILASVLSVLRFITTDHSFGIFKHIFQIYHNILLVYVG